MKKYMNKETSQVSVVSSNPEETFFIGKIIGEHLTKGDVLALMGELGTGKTCFTHGVARGMGVPERFRITSPSFTLINEYEGRMNLYHFDLYRLQGSQDMEDLGYEEYLFGEGVSVIEWADKIKDVISEEALRISFKYLDENRREIVISGQKKRIVQILNALKSGGF
jgi:tRNA threonylcarbamoyladenosine biosynthesis protein TsaE